MAFGQDVRLPQQRMNKMNKIEINVPPTSTLKNCYSLHVGAAVSFFYVCVH